MYEIYNPRCDIGPGLNKRALKINQMMGYFGAAMGHLYVLGACMEYRIAKVIKSRKEFHVCQRNDWLKFIQRKIEDDI